MSRHCWAPWQTCLNSWWASSLRKYRWQLWEYSVACRRCVGRVRAIELLVAAGASLSARGEHGYSPLHEAAEQGHLRAVACLLQLGASEAVRDEEGRTPLQIAEAAGSDEVVEYLSGR